MRFKNVSLGLLAIFCGLAGIGQTTSQSQITVSGKVSGDLKGYDKLYIYIGHDDKDSTTIKDGRYSFSIPFRAAAYVALLPEVVLKSRRGYMINPILTDLPGAYTINLDMAPSKPDQAYARLQTDASGTEATNLYEVYKKQKEAIYKKVQEEITANNADAKATTATQSAASAPTTVATAPTTAAAAPPAGSNADTAKRTGKTIPATGVGRSMMQQQYSALSRQYLVPVMEDFAKQHPDSYASIFILQTEGLNMLNIDQQEQTYALLSERIKNSPDGKRFNDHLQGTENGVVGNTVAPFTLDDPAGKKIDLASFKGKYVLIDFWASWCGPCRKSFPYMRKLYAAYKNPSFEIYSISIDKKKADWLKAVGQENNPWPQSLDTIDISDAGFGVGAIPTAVLLDPQGRIVARETGIETDGTDGIEKKLAELFGKKM